MKIKFGQFKRLLLSRWVHYCNGKFTSFFIKSGVHGDSCYKHALSSERNQRQYSPHNSGQLRISSTTKKGKRRRDWKQKNFKKSRREAFFLRMEELLRKVGGGNERDKNAWKRKIDAEKQSVNERRKSHSGIKSKSFSYPPKYHWLLNFHISLYLYTIRHLWLVMSSSSSNTNGTVSRQNSAWACAVIKPKQQQEQENEEKESKQWRTTFQAEKKRDKEGTNNTAPNLKSTHLDN